MQLSGWDFVRCLGRMEMLGIGELLIPLFSKPSARPETIANCSATRHRPRPPSSNTSRSPKMVQMYTIAGRQVGSHVVSPPTTNLCRGQWSLVLTPLALALQLAMLTLGTVFGGVYLSLSGGSKKAQAPPINASTPDEADFIKCAVLPCPESWQTAKLTRFLESSLRTQKRRTRKQSIERLPGSGTDTDWGHSASCRALYIL